MGLHRTKRTDGITLDQEDRWDYTGPRGQMGLHWTKRTDGITLDQDDRWDYTGPRVYTGFLRPRGWTALDRINRTEG
jgi:hypothetical protein